MLAVRETVETAQVSEGGLKAFGGQLIKAGSIIVRQVGTKIHPGNNVGMGKDFTLFATIQGVVTFERYGKDRKKVSVYAPQV